MTKSKEEIVDIALKIIHDNLLDFRTISMYCPKCKKHNTFEVFERSKPYVLHPHIVKCVGCGYMSNKKEIV